MTDAAQRDLLDAIARLAILVAAAYLAIHLIRFIVLTVNRGIDRDVDATYRRMGHHRYAGPDGRDDRDPDGPAHDGAHDGAHDRDRDDPDDRAGQLGIEWLCKRVRERRAVAGDVAHDGARPDGRGGQVGRAVAVGHGGGSRGSGGGSRAGRATRPVVVVTGGAFAGARVRVLMESRGCPGLFFVEIVDGEARGLLAVVDGGWLDIG